MAYSLVINGQAQATIDASVFNVGKANTLTVQSSNGLQTNATVTTGSWTSLSLGTLTNVAYISAVNDNAVNTASVVQLASNNTNTGILATIQPGCPALIPWSGSITLYGTVASGSVGSTGVIQYYVQQS